MTDSTIFVQPSDADWVEVGPGVRRRLLCHDKSLMMVEVGFEKGAVGAPHSHPHIQVSLVASGCFEVTVGDEIQVLEAGGSFRTPADVVHSVIALESGALIDCFTPRREDFLG